jgi:glycosidase
LGVKVKRLLLIFISIISLVGLVAPSWASEDLTTLARSTARGPLAAESVYFVMTDRFENGDKSNDGGGLTGGRLGGGDDPTDIAYYHGGDFKGLTSRLEYIANLGFTSIWITPPVVNQFVQQGSAGYHGYWGTDFTTIDPHYGTEADFKNFVSRSHALGMKVIVDIVVNHTADVIKYSIGSTTYREPADFPYKTCAGKLFEPSKFAGLASFPQLCVKNSFAYIPRTSTYDRKIKKPDFLNDLTNYHNRGDSIWSGTSVTQGDFVGLDDVFTEKPEVVKGMIDLWSGWITKFDIDGYRVDTAKHVNPEFWKAFVPKILATAKSVGKNNFPIFGEVADSDIPFLASFVTEQKFPSVLDFPFQAKVSRFAKAGGGAADLATLFNADDMYTTPTTSAYSLATFMGNHDMGRIGRYIAIISESDGAQVLLERAKLANALLFTLRGGPVLYYGDEKGMTGEGGDQLARQNMFPTQVEAWKSELRIGSQPIGTASAFDVKNPLEENITQLQKLYSEYPALKSGTQQLRYANGSVFAVSRFANNQELIAAFNSNDEPQSATFSVSTTSSQWTQLLGKATATTQNSEITINLPSRGWVILKADKKFEPSHPLSIQILNPKPDYSTPGWSALTAKVPGDDFVEVTFAIRQKGKSWQILGTADRRTFKDDNVQGGLHRIYLHNRLYKSGTQLEIAAIARNTTGEKIASKVINYTIKY